MELYDSTVLLLDMYPKELGSRVWKRYFYTTFIAVLFTIAKRWKPPKCTWMDE